MWIISKNVAVSNSQFLEITLSECNRINPDNKYREYKSKKEDNSSYKLNNSQINKESTSNEKIPVINRINIQNWNEKENQYLLMICNIVIM